MDIAEAYIAVTASFGLACIVALVSVGPVAWAIGDAQKRGQTGCLIVLLFFLLGPLSAVVWIIARPRQKLADCSPDQYSDPNNALAAAARLDQLGEWEAAISLYGSADQRWPDYHDYIAACLKDIKRKQEVSWKRIK